MTCVKAEEACRLVILEGWELGIEVRYGTVLAGSEENSNAKGNIC